ncbi:class I SAM-dependent methyltransferase [Marichromatium bheemlicum]|uniref:Class I SAM-dependent methyltransferase n=2 Tax=Marichromatium bheemlicum TaxID=365339 RepID=A0ABX1I9X5_9GAMM|nr:class I SAM-dependent methyltransferase [Marichromatium bheemlicum]NKN34344.1 class I SAM-dependent methyltransferase [Marichromatium bheemlicum]
MDTEEQARAYAEADFSESNSLFMRLLARHASGGLPGTAALDLGCGPADIVHRLLRTYPRLHCDALDGAMTMLEQARTTLEAGGEPFAGRWQLIHDRLPSSRLEGCRYDLILSNSLLHHLHDPQVLWQTIRTQANPDALVLVMDLFRPPSAGWAEALVETYVADEPEVLRSDFRHSLFAAYEPCEVVEQLNTAGLEGFEVGVVSDRHLAVWGRMPG